MNLDRLIIEFDKGLRAVFAPASTVRPVPGEQDAGSELTDKERALAARLMRVNHSGEVCAQALYQGQALSSKDATVRAALDAAAREETEHLAWTERRIEELGGRKSLLNPLWYGGSLAIGWLAGKLGDSWNLGFLAETERQVEAHLETYKARLPKGDHRSARILEQMRLDERRHSVTAARLGGRELPEMARAAMRCASRVMTETAYRI